MTMKPRKKGTKKAPKTLQSPSHSARSSRAGDAHDAHNIASHDTTDLSAALLTSPATFTAHEWVNGDPFEGVL